MAERIPVGLVIVGTLRAGKHAPKIQGYRD
jgi:hypothetical protein